MDDKIKRCVEMYGEDPSKVKKLITDYGKARVNYYSFHTGKKWGSYENYNLAINTSYISDEEAANLPTITPSPVSAICLITSDCATNSFSSTDTGSAAKASPKVIADANV